MENSTSVEKVTLSLKFTSQLTNILIDVVESNVSLDISRLDIKYLTGFDISFVKIERGYSFNFEGRFDYVLKKTAKQYLEYVKYLDSVPDKHFLEFSETFPIVHELRSKYIKIIKDFLQYVTWKKDIYKFRDGVMLEIIPSKCYWNIENVSGNDFEGEVFFRVLSAFCIMEKEILIADSDLEDFYKFQTHNVAVPLHQELFDEVERLMLIKSDRSAYLMLYASFEIATKTLIGHLKPETEWLILNMPSPPLNLLYSDYIDKISEEILSEKDKSKLKDMTSIRNKITHKGATLKNETLKEHYEIIKGWLKKIDLIIGHKTA